LKTAAYLLFAIQLFGAETGDPRELKSAEPPRSGARFSKLPPPDVQRGDKVAVIVVSGAIQLKFDAETESAGHIGETVIVKNPENGRRFVARVEEKGKVVVKK